MFKIQQVMFYQEITSKTAVKMLHWLYDLWFISDNINLYCYITKNNLSIKIASIQSFVVFFMTLFFNYKYLKYCDNTKFQQLNLLSFCFPSPSTNRLFKDKQVFTIIFEFSVHVSKTILFFLGTICYMYF